MKRIFIISVLSIATLLVTSECKKVDQTNPEFIGFWSASDGQKDYVIDIDQDAEGLYKESEGIGTSSEWKGKVKYKNGELKFGAFKKLIVNEEPSTNQGITTMVVENKTFVKNQ